MAHDDVEILIESSITLLNLIGPNDPMFSFHTLLQLQGAQASKFFQRLLSQVKNGHLIKFEKYERLLQNVIFRLAMPRTRPDCHTAYASYFLKNILVTAPLTLFGHQSTNFDRGVILC